MVGGPPIYLDANATTRPASEVVEAMLPYLGEVFANPSSLHRAGRHAGRAVDAARERIAAFLGARSAEVVLGSGGTEAVNLAIRGALAAARRAGRGRRVIASAVEHPSVKGTIERLSAAGDCQVDFIGVDREGRLDLAALRAALERTPPAALASIMWANNETGVLFPIDEVAALCRSAGVPLHVDAVQVAGKLPIRARALAVDFLSVSAHKLHGPKGAGALYVRNGAALEPILTGGHQERGLRGGTENVPAIIGFAAACDAAERALAAGAPKRMAALRDRLEEAILRAVPGAARNGAREPRVPGTTSLRFEGADGEALLLELSRRGIAASSGAACTSGSLEPSHVLTAMGLSAREALGSIRLSLSRETTEEEIERAIPEIVDAVRLVRKVASAPAATPVKVAE